MKSAVETLSPTRVKLTVEVPFEELKPSLTAAYKRIGAQITVPGFRKGKVPAAIIDQRVGRAAVLDEAINEALPQVYNDAVKENDLKPLGQPEIDLGEVTDGADLNFTAEVDVRPEITLPDVSGLEIQVDDIVVTDEDVQADLDTLRARFGTLKTVERPVQTGDVVSVDLAATFEGAPIEDATANGLSYEVGGNQLIAGIDEAIIGLEAGGSSSFVSTDFGGEWIDKNVDVAVTVNAVKERELPELDDDFAQLASEFDTLDELRDAVRAQATEVKKVEQGSQARDKVLEHLLEVVEIPIPEKVLEQEIEGHFQDGHGDDEHKAEFAEGAEKSIKTQLLLDEIAQTEKLSVSEAELVDYLIRQSSRYGMSPDQFVGEVVKAGQTQMFVGEVVRVKALASVLEKAKVTDASGNEVDLSALTASNDDEDATPAE